MKKTITLLFFFCVLFAAAQPAGWAYNQTVTVNNPNTVNAVDYQLRMTINTQSLVSNGWMNANGSDLRFGPTCTSTAFYNYWIESGINTATTVVWVKVPYIAASSSTVMYMFYGNASASPVSTIPGTFRGPNSSTDSISGGTINSSPGVNQRGFRFSPNQNLLVTHFGKNEPNGTTRYVTIFNYTSQAIVSQTQVPGPASVYSYAPISNPLWLNQGTQYVIQMFGNGSEGYFYQTSSQIGQHLTYYEMQYSNGGSQNSFPNSTLANYHYGYGDFWYYVCSTLAITPTYSFNSAPISITGPTGAICSGSTVTLTTNASGTYSWSTGPTNTPAIVISNPSGSPTYSVVQPNASGCAAIAIIQLTVNSGPPVLSVTQSTNVICPTNTVMISATGAITYTWSGGITNGVPFSPASTATYVVVGTNGCGTASASANVSVTPLPVVAITSPTLICAGQPATLTAAGAVNYTWNPGNNVGQSVVVTAAAPTVFTVVGTTSVCAGISTVALAVDPLPTVTPSGNTFTLCEGNSLTLTANGAGSYTWMPGALTGSSIVVSPNVSTAYNITGENSYGCTSGASQIVLVSQAPLVTLSSNKLQVCEGGSATLTANGANTYVWSVPGSGSVVVVSPSSNTTYSVTGTNTLTGCSSTKTISVGSFTVPLTVSPATNVCLGGTVTLTAGGANSYTWTNGPVSSFYAVAPTTSTVYTVSAITATSGMNCQATGSVQVTVNPLPVILAASTRTMVCKNEVATFTVGGAQTYTWNGSLAAATYTLKATLTSGYTVNVTGTDANGCENSTNAVLKVSTCSGLDENLAGKTLYIYPNPNKGEFNLYSSIGCHAKMISETGQLIKEFELKRGNNLIDLVDIAPGVYFITGNDPALREPLIITGE